MFEKVLWNYLLKQSLADFRPYILRLYKLGIVKLYMLIVVVKLFFYVFKLFTAKISANAWKHFINLLFHLVNFSLVVFSVGYENEKRLVPYPSYASFVKAVYNGFGVSGDGLKLYREHTVH